MFAEYYLKTASKRALIAALLFLLTLVWGWAVSLVVVPAYGLALESWLQRFYMCGLVSLLCGLAVAAFWFKEGLTYDQAGGRPIEKIYKLCGLGAVAAGLVVAGILLPRAYEWGLAAQLWLVLLAPAVYYLDSIFAGAYPVQFVPPFAKLLYTRLYSRVAPRVLEGDVRFEKDFFTPNLCLLPAGDNELLLLNTQSGQELTWQDQRYQFLYPVREQVLEHVPAGDLAKLVKVTVTELGNKPVVQVQLIVPGKDVRLAPFYFTRTYTEAEFVFCTRMPELSLWPDFELTGLKCWSRYYTYFDDDGNAELYVRPYRGWDVPDTLRRVETASGRDHKEIRCGSSYPRVLAVTGRDGKQELGLLVTVPPQLLHVTNQRKCAVSVDFGTTNTTICYAMEGTAPAPMVLHDHLRHFFSLQGKKSTVRRFFLPEDTAIGCAWIMSAFHSFNELPEMVARIFQKGNIFFVRNFGDLADLTNVTADLKWDVEKRDLTEGFLEQICTQCLAEMAINGATEVEWRFSYPKSFTVNEKLSYDHIWEQVRQNLERNTGAKEHPELMVACLMDSNYIVPESVAVAAYYDRDYGADRANGIICMDIGGGSTDLAFWYGAKPDITWQTSLRLAGRQIFRDILFTKANIKFLRELKLDAEFDAAVVELAELAENKQNTANFNAQDAFGLKLDALLKAREKDIAAAWADGCQRSPVLLRLRRAILLAMSGLLYYAGMVFGQQYKQGAFDHLTRFHAVYIGGNGSKLLDLAAGGNYNENCAEYKILAQLFRDGIRCNLGTKSFEQLMQALDFKVITINKSRQPKEEVAYGLLYDETAAIEKLLQELGHTGVNDQAVAGEVFADEGVTAKDGLLTRINLRHRLSVDARLPVFKTFLKDFNAQTEHFLHYRTTVYADDVLFLMREAINKNLADKRLQAENDLAVEPLFALALEKAMIVQAELLQEDPKPKHQWLK